MISGMVQRYSDFLTNSQDLREGGPGITLIRGPRAKKDPGTKIYPNVVCNVSTQPLSQEFPTFL